MPVRSTKGLDASLPGGALRLDVNPSEESDAVLTARGPSPNVVPTIQGAYAMAQYGSEAVMYALNGAGLSSVNGPTNFTAIPFTNVEVDYSQLTDLPQCNATDGTFTAQHEGFFEVGLQVVAYSFASVVDHLELSIWIDTPGGPGLPLNPSPNPFGTSNPSGDAWSRIANRTTGGSAAQWQPGGSVADAPGHMMAVTTVWAVHPTDSVASSNGPRYLTTAPAPVRFRFAMRNDVAGGAYLRGDTPYQCRAWMRWLGATGFSGP